MMNNYNKEIWKKIDSMEDNLYPLWKQLEDFSHSHLFDENFKVASETVSKLRDLANILSNLKKDCYL